VPNGAVYRLKLNENDSKFVRGAQLRRPRRFGLLRKLSFVSGASPHVRGLSRFGDEDGKEFLRVKIRNLE
jgi:hypothetical protein